MFSCHMSTRLRQFGPVGALLVLSVVGFFLARALGESNARRDSDHRAEIAAVQVRDRVVQAMTLVDGVRRLLVSEPTPLTQADFVQVGALWLAPSGLPAAGWVERVPAAARAAYERRIDHPIVTPAATRALVPARARRTYYPATFVTGSPPMSTEGVDLGGIAAVVTAMTRPQTEFGVTATPLLRLADGTPGLFLVESGQRVDEQGVYPGYAVVFVPASWLLEAVTATGDVNASGLPSLQIRAGGGSAGDLHGAAPARSSFTEAGLPFEVLVPRTGVRGAAAALPWIVLAGGLLLAGVAWVLGVFAARRKKAKAELDRLFTLTPDLIVVAGFDGFLKRVNPAFEQHLGYSEEEALARPYVEFVHPDDRVRTEAESSHLREGTTTESFENRCVCKDGSYRWIEWISTPVQHERQIYSVGRDVTERRQAEAYLRAAEKRHRELAEEQSALRRVATLVAEGAPPEDVFTAVAAEVGQLLPAAMFASVGRYSVDHTVTFAGTWSRSGEIVAPRTLSLGGQNASTLVHDQQQPVRIDRYTGASDISEAVQATGMRSAVGAPISVAGQLWGVMIVNARDEDAFPAGAEQRLAEFTELVAAALSNTEAREELREVADEQAALRRVATLAASGAPSPEVFAAVAEEVQRLVPSEFVFIGRYNEDRTVTYVGAWDGGRAVTDEATLPLGGRNLTTMIYESGRPARLDTYEDASGLSIAKAHARGITTGVGVPITVGGRLWGVVVASVTGGKDVHPDTERRLAEFTRLLATAISNAEAQAALAASRARMLVTADETRRRFGRDLHDGAQQRFVAAALTVRAAKAAVPPDLPELAAELERAAAELTRAIDELREFAQGIHPAVLVEGGLGPALRMLARRSSVPTKLELRADGRLPEPIEVAAYYVVSEALTNAAKHAEASVVEVDLEVDDGALRVRVRDDGVGGAVFARGSGLFGVKDRVEALGGRIRVESPPGLGTSIAVKLPLDVGDRSDPG